MNNQQSKNSLIFRSFWDRLKGRFYNLRRKLLGFFRPTTVSVDLGEAFLYNLRRLGNRLLPFGTRRRLVCRWLINQIKRLLGVPPGQTLGGLVLLKCHKLKQKVLPFGTKRRVAYEWFSQILKGLLALVIPDGTYETWIAEKEPNKSELEKQRRLSKTFKYSPKISILLPVFNPTEQFFIETIESLLVQTYGRWELCLAVDNSQQPYIKAIIDSYAGKDHRIKVKWLRENKHVWSNSNEALSLVTGEFVGLLNHNDTLAPFGLYEVVRLLNNKRDLDLIYSDEDKISEDGHTRFDPYFKPDWAPDTFRSYDYLSHFIVIRKTLITKFGSFRLEFRDSQNYDLLLRITERTNKIYHIPKILYHSRDCDASTGENPPRNEHAYESAKKALSEHISRLGLRGTVQNNDYYPRSYRIKYLIKGKHQVSIIIPNKDKVVLLKNCIQSVFEKTIYRNYDVTIIDNNSCEKQTFEYYEKIKINNKVKVLEYNKPFNFSVMNNFAVSQTNGEILLFLNSDTEVINEGWIEAMLGFAQRKDVGAVGAKLYYPDDTIQHGGVVVGIGGVADHAPKSCSKDCVGYFGRLSFVQNLSAVTAACLMMRRKVFEEVRGFGEEFPGAFGDTDLCLKMREKGYLIVWTPYAELYHHETVAARYDDTFEKQARFMKWCELFRQKWKDFLVCGDPYYNPNLTLEKKDFSIKI